MKHTHLGAACVLAVMAASGPALASPADAYDPMALDQFIAQSLAAGDALAGQGSQVVAPAQTGTMLAQEGPRADGQPFIVGPDGKRIDVPFRPRWRVGVFR